MLHELLNKLFRSYLLYIGDIYYISVIFIIYWYISVIFKDVAHHMTLHGDHMRSCDDAGMPEL